MGTEITLATKPLTAFNKVSFEDYRICKKCGDEHLIDNFPKNKDSESGHSWVCKKCRAIYDADRWKKKKAERKKVDRMIEKENTSKKLKDITPRSSAHLLLKYAGKPHSSAKSLLKHAGKWVGDPLEKFKSDDLLKRIQRNAIKDFIENNLIPGIKKMVEKEI